MPAASTPTTPESGGTRSWLSRFRWPLGITLVAIVVRVVWTLKIHPPSSYIYSDMLAYTSRAARLAGQPFGGPWPDEPFFPWGTHYLLGGLVMIAGKTPMLLGALWGTLNAALAPLAYFLAGRLHGGPTWGAIEHGRVAPTADLDDLDELQAMTRAVARVAGCFMIVYYPALSFAGFYLSESPFMVLVTASALAALKLADSGRSRDAVLLGVTLALAFAVRAQILAAVGFLAVFMVWRRRSFPLVGWRQAVLVAAPLVAMLAFSTHLSHRHTGKLTPLPHNGPVNRAFGRCHAYEIKAYNSMFGPPAFGALHRYEKKVPSAWIKLRPAIDDKLTVKARMNDADALHALADRCVAESGHAKQAYYAMSHVVLLWGYHVAWPDMAMRPFRFHMRGWTRAHLIVFVFPALVGMAMGANRRHPRHGVVAMFLWSLLASVMLYMGAARFRVPYDAVSIVMGLDVYGRAAVWLTRAWRLRREAKQAAR